MNKFKNSVITLSGLAFLTGVIAVGSPQNSFGQKTGSQPAASPTSGPQNVNVVNTPNVTVTNTPTVNAQQSGTWNVGIAGTPTVNLAGGTSVGITGTPTVNLAVGTVLAYDQTTTVQQFGAASLPQLDVSMFKEIRVVFTVNGAIDYILVSRIVNPNDAAEVVVLENLNLAQTGRGTKTYDIPGQRIDFVLNGSNFGPSTVHVQVFGRSN